MASISDEEYYMTMPTDFDYRVMEGIVKACSKDGSEWEGIISKYNRGERTIRFTYSLYLSTFLGFITEVSKKLDSCAEATEEMREQLMNVEFEATAYEENCYHFAVRYRVVRKNGRATVLHEFGNAPYPCDCDTGEFLSYEDFLEDMKSKCIEDDNRPTDVICRMIWPEGEDNPHWDYWEDDSGSVYIYGPPEEIAWFKWGDDDEGDLYSYKI